MGNAFQGCTADSGDDFLAAGDERSLRVAEGQRRAEECASPPGFTVPSAAGRVLAPHSLSARASGCTHRYIPSGSLPTTPCTT